MPTEKSKADNKWREAWYPTDPIENRFLKLEKIFVQTIITGLAYTRAQLIDKVLDKVKQLGLYMTSIMD